MFDSKLSVRVAMFMGYFSACEFMSNYLNIWYIFAEISISA